MQATSRDCIPSAVSSVTIKTQSYQGGPLRHDRTFSCYAPALSLCHALIFFSVLPLCVLPVRFSVPILDYFGRCHDLDV